MYERTQPSVWYRQASTNVFLMNCLLANADTALSFFLGVLGLHYCLGFLQLQPAGFTLCGAWASHCGGFSCCRTRALGQVGFSSCGTWAQLLGSMWNLAGPGIKLVSPALAGRLLTTGPAGRSGINKRFYKTVPFASLILLLLNVRAHAHTHTHTLTYTCTHTHT